MQKSDGIAIFCITSTEAYNHISWKKGHEYNEKDYHFIAGSDCYDRACIVSFAANDFSAYEAWSKKNELAMQYMMNQNGWSHDSDHDHHDRHDHQDGESGDFHSDANGEGRS